MSEDSQMVLWVCGAAVLIAAIIAIGAIFYKSDSQTCSEQHCSFTDGLPSKCECK